MTALREPTPEQRACDGRLAWIIVGCCAVVTLILIGVAIAALRGPMARMATAGVPQRVEPPVPPGAEPTSVSRSAPSLDSEPATADGLQVQKAQTAPPPSRPVPDAAPRAGVPEISKRSSERANEATKSAGGGGGEEEDVGRDDDPPPAEEPDRRHRI